MDKKDIVIVGELSAAETEEFLNQLVTDKNNCMVIENSPELFKASK